MHPVNSEDFGANGMTIYYSVDGSTTITGSIVKQVGDTKYIVAPAGQLHNAAAYATITLATTTAQVTALPAHVGTVHVMPFGTSTTEHAARIYSRKLVTVEGNQYNWRKTTASHPGECNVVGNWNTGPDASGFSDKVNV